MPGKVNPVIPEVVNQVAFEVIGNDVTVTMAAEAGQLQLNAFEPIIAQRAVPEITHLPGACLTLPSGAWTASPPTPRRCARPSRTPSAWSPPSTRTSATRPPTSVAAEAFAEGTNVRGIVLRAQV